MYEPSDRVSDDGRASDGVVEGSPLILPTDHRGT